MVRKDLITVPYLRYMYCTAQDYSCTVYFVGVLYQIYVVQVGGAGVCAYIQQWEQLL